MNRQNKGSASSALAGSTNHSNSSYSSMQRTGKSNNNGLSQPSYTGSAGRATSSKQHNIEPTDLSGSLEDSLDKFPFNWNIQSILFWSIIIVAVLFLCFMTLAFYYYRRLNLCQTTPGWCYSDWVCPDRNPYQEAKRIQDDLVLMASQTNPQSPPPTDWLASGRASKRT